MQNKYNHYWMQAILKHGWGNKESNINYLNLQDILYANKKNVVTDFSILLESSKIIGTSNILGSYVISKDTEDNINVLETENKMLDFIKNRIMYPNISDNDLIFLKEYCFLQIMRNPISYNEIYDEIYTHYLIEKEFISNVTYENKPNIDFTIDEDLFLSKIQTTKIMLIENSFRKKEHYDNIFSKNIFIFDISKYDIGFVVGDLTYIDFSSKIILSNQNLTLLNDMLSQYNLKFKKYKPLLSTILIPITSNKFILLYDCEKQKELINEILEKIIHYYNLLQFKNSSGIILPFNQNKNLFNKNHFYHLLDRENVSEFLRKNINFKLNKFLHKKKTNEYFNLYDDTINKINSLQVLKKISFEDRAKEINSCYLKSTNNFKNFSNLSDFKFMFNDIFEFYSNGFHILFFFIKNGTILYTVNSSKIEFFCLNYYDFFSRFILLLSTLKLTITMPVKLLFYYKDTSPKSYYKQLITPFSIEKELL